LVETIVLQGCVLSHSPLACQHLCDPSPLTSSIACSGTPSRSLKQLETEVENIGGRLDAYTAREITSYTGRSLADGVPKMTEIIGDMLSNPKFEPSAIEAERSTILREAEEVGKEKQEAIFDQLHAVAFQGQCLAVDAGRIVGPSERGVDR